MEKNTILAVALSTVVLIISFILQGVFFPRPQPVPVEQSAAAAPAQDAVAPQMSAFPVEEPASPSIAQVPDINAPLAAAESEGAQRQEYVIIETELMEVILTNAGGNIVSWKLRDHIDGEDNVNMIFSGTNEAKAFSVAFGGPEGRPINSLFSVNRVTDYIVEFSRSFQVSSTDDRSFTLTKRYEFKPRDHMFELNITLDGGNDVSYFNWQGNAYTLSFGPQIGPVFEKLDNRYDFRQFGVFVNGKLRNAKVNDMIESRPSWAAISGKYFAFIALPYPVQFTLNFSNDPEPGLPTASRLNIIRPAVNSSRVTDTYRFYLGPKSQEALGIYNTGRNEFGLRDTHLLEAASSRGILSPLEKALKWFLLVFYRIVPNYGVSIILLTLLIKIIFFPLTKKGSEAMVRMQALTPRIKEIQDKYKNNPQKLQVEMGNFYKQEGYNPLSGCLPMLLQIPIFIAMYNLFNNHFDLRGAMFIPGWIPDLSVPEFIWESKSGGKLPILGWNAFRILPFVYVASQIVYSKVTQMPGQQQNPQMKMIMYVRPILFFFMLYNLPSGVLIYWIFSNLLTMVQQIVINRYIMAKKAHEAAQVPTVIAPPPKKKKKK
jgi:YidC/Oxa1 family membrane protein insertase